jgi:selenocysteine-specific elongation factor
MLSSLEAAGKVTQTGDTVALSSHKPQASSGQEEKIAAIKELFSQNRNSPPTVKEIATQVAGGGDILRFMRQQNMLVELPEGILLEKEHYQQIEKGVIDFLEKNGQISIQDIGKLFGFSRKYIIPLLTYLDAKKITRRQGNVRVLYGG